MRQALEEAISVLREGKDIEEPSERDTREALHLDHDRKGVSGSPDLAPTIFDKIDKASVFIADVTLVAKIELKNEDNEKKLINSNVAIEYGYALRALSARRILMVQNTYYGAREALPFDLRHKAGPILFRLSPDADTKTIKDEATKLKRVLVEALKPLTSEIGQNESEKFNETPSTTSPACFWSPGEALASYETSPLAKFAGHEDEGTTNYTFFSPHILYLRLIPTKALSKPLDHTFLIKVVQDRSIAVLTRSMCRGGGVPGRNRFGSLAYEPYGGSGEILGLTQLFPSGELWGVSHELVRNFQGSEVLPMVNVQNIFDDTVVNYADTALNRLGVTLPVILELGATGLKNVRLSLPQGRENFPNQLSERILEDKLQVRYVLNAQNVSSLKKPVSEFVKRLYDLTGISL